MATLWTGPSRLLARLGALPGSTWLVIGAVVAVLTLAGAAAGVGTTSLAAGLIAPPADPGPLDRPESAPEGGEGVVAEATAGSEAGPDREPPGARTRPARRGLSRDAYVEAIVERNVFDHDAAGKPPTEETAPGEETLTELDVVLLGTVVHADPTRSAALIRRGQRGETAGYGIGDRLLDAVIREIDPERVILERSDGRREILTGDMDRDESGRRGRRRGRKGQGDDAIAKVDDGHYEVSRALVDELLSDPKGLRKLGRARPYKRNGEVIGFRLYRIRRNSLGRKIGLRSGDVITEVNGTKLNATRAALSLMTELNQASTFDVKVRKRNGKTRDLKLDLR